MADMTTTWCDLPIGPVRVRTAGAGPAIVFTHGLLVDGRIWDEVAGPVAQQGFMVVLPDLPLGAHERPVHDRAALTTQAVADTVFDLADHLGIDRFTMLGFDTGGAITQLATAARPERIERLALLSCDAFEHFPPALVKPIKWAAAWSPTMSLTLRSFSDPRLQRWALPLGWVAKKKMDPALVHAWSAPTRTNPEVRADLVAFIRQMTSADTLAAAEQLRSYAGPSMVMWSREDRIFPKKDAHRLTELIPGCQLRWIDDAYTFAPLDNPARMVELVGELLGLP